MGNVSVDTNALRLVASGAIGLLCECALSIGEGPEADERRDNIERCISDWCEVVGWSYTRTMNRIEVFYPTQKSPQAIACTVDRCDD